MKANCAREKNLTNVRVADKDESTAIATPTVFNLEQALKWIKEDEIVEISPNAIKRKNKFLGCNLRPA